MSSLPGLLQAQAIERPDEPFLFYKDQVWNFAELDWVSSAAGARFQNLGLLAKERVALLLGSRPEFVISFFGALKTGAVAVPLDPRLATADMARILKSSGAAGLVLGEEHAGRSSELRSLCPELRWTEALEAADTKAAALARWGAAGELTPAPEREGNPACLIYASGAAGRPRGAVLSHRNCLWAAETTARALGVTAADRLLGFPSLHDVNAQVVTLLMPLCVGAGVVLMERFPPQEFFRLIEKHRCTAVSAAPSDYSALLSLPETERRSLGSLRFCLSGSAPLAPEVRSGFEAAFETCVLEGYGLAEAASVCCVNPAPPGLRKAGSAGRPLPGQAVAVFNDEDMRLPPGEIGEIRVQGPNVMKGYFNDPAATAQALRGGWLRTGDLGWHDAEGYFYLSGRRRP